MKGITNMKRTTNVLAALFIGTILAIAPTFAADRTETDRPPIEILKAPSVPPGEGSLYPISGKIAGAKPGDCRVVVYSFGDKWYVQPWAAAPFTEINKDLTWKGQTRGSFPYLALLVRSSFKPAATLNAPPEVGGEVLAITIKYPTNE